MNSTTCVKPWKLLEWIAMPEQKTGKEIEWWKKEWWICLGCGRHGETDASAVSHECAVETKDFIVGRRHQ